MTELQGTESQDTLGSLHTMTPSSLKGSVILARDLGFFITPNKADLEWIAGDEQFISWNTDYPAYTIGIWQEDPERQSARSGLVILSRTCTIPL